MVLSKLKNRSKDSGFTLVELLIVIVVIAILAAITIVAYGNVSARAKTTQGSATAANVVKVAEAVNASNTAYPITTATPATNWKGTDSSGNTVVTLPSGITLVAGTGTPGAISAITAATFGWSSTTTPADGNSVGVVFTCSGTGVASGGAVFYYDFGAKALATGNNVRYFGTATSASNPWAASC